MPDDHRVKRMNDVVTFEHRGVPCAMSAHAVAYAGTVADTHSVMSLWPADAGAGHVDRYLSVVTPTGRELLPCSRVRVGRGGAMLSRLPPLLATALRSSHITALLELDGVSFWFIDFGGLDG